MHKKCACAIFFLHFSLHSRWKAPWKGGKKTGRFSSDYCFYGNFNAAKIFGIMGKKDNPLASLLLVEPLQK